MRIINRIQSLVLAGLVFAVLATCGSSEKQAESTKLSQDRDSIVVELVAEDSITALQLLLSEHEADYRSSLMGAFVLSIDSIEGSSAAFWVYSVNDTTPKVACDKLILNPGDRMKWHLRRVTTDQDKN